MLIVNVINTLPNIEDRKMKTSMTIILSWDLDRKRTEGGKINKTCVSSQNHRMRKEEGATVAATPYLPSGETVPAGLVRAERAAILHGDLTLQESPIKYR